MICGDRIDGAIFERLSQGLDVGCRAQRWVHLSMRIIATHRLIGQEQMMRRDFGRDAQPSGFGIMD
jgi:hypothetical protein